MRAFRLRLSRRGKRFTGLNTGGCTRQTLPGCLKTVSAASDVASVEGFSPRLSFFDSHDALGARPHGAARRDKPRPAALHQRAGALERSARVETFYTCDKSHRLLAASGVINPGAGQSLIGKMPRVEPPT